MSRPVRYTVRYSFLRSGAVSLDEAETVTRRFRDKDNVLAYLNRLLPRAVKTDTRLHGAVIRGKNRVVFTSTGISN